MLLVDRYRFPCQGGLVRRQAHAFAQPTVRRDAVAGGQHDDVARHQFGGGDGAFDAVSDDAGKGHYLPPKCFERPFGPPLRDKP